MAKLSGIGAPSRKTKGAVGDIYIDTKTGEEYTCTFSYKSCVEEEFECDWKKSTNKEKTQTAVVHREVKNEDKAKVHTNVVKENEEYDKEPDVTDDNEETTQKRTDYSAYSKPCKK